MTDRHTRLSELMQARRLELGMKTWRALATEAGVAYETLRAMRAGENVAAGTAHAVERALQWAPGSIETIIDGGDPIKAARGDLRISVGDPRPQADDEKLERAAALLAEGAALLEEIRRERRQGA